MSHELPHRESHRSTQLTPAEKTCLELIKAEIEEIKEGKTEKQLREQGKTDVLQRLLAKLEEKKNFSKDEKQRKRIMEKRREKLVKFRDKQIPLCEYWALEKMLEDINKDYAEQRYESGETEPKDLKLDDVEIKIEDESVVFINLEDQKFRKVPFAFGILKKLKRIDLDNNPNLSDISALSGLTNLQKLFLYSNEKLEDINALSGLTNLQILFLNNNLKLEDIKELSGLTNLETLILDNNPKLSDISALEHLNNLTYVNLRNTGINKQDTDTKRIINKLRLRGCGININ